MNRTRLVWGAIMEDGTLFDRTRTSEGGVLYELSRRGPGGPTLKRTARVRIVLESDWRKRGKHE